MRLPLALTLFALIPGCTFGAKEEPCTPLAIRIDPPMANGTIPLLMILTNCQQTPLRVPDAYDCGEADAWRLEAQGADLTLLLSQTPLATSVNDTTCITTLVKGFTLATHETRELPRWWNGTYYGEACEVPCRAPSGQYRLHATILNLTADSSLMLPAP